MEKILFFIKRKKPLKDGTLPIFVRVKVNGTSCEIATGKSTIESQWIVAKGRVKGNNLTNKQINSWLEQLQYKLHELAIDVRHECISYTAKDIINRYKGLTKPVIGILELYTEHNEEQKELIGKVCALATYKRHETSLKLFKEFLMVKYNVCDLPINKVNAEVLRKYQTYLMTGRNNNNNTTVKYLKNLGKVLNLAVSRQLITLNPLTHLTLRTLPVERDFLEKCELEALTKKEFGIERLDNIKDVFLFCCYTGLAYMDVSTLSPGNFYTDDNGIQWVRKARHKTNVICEVPLIGPTLAILKKYESLFNITGKMLPVCTNQKMNAYLKEIADIMGFKKQLTMHMARHTFATTVALANNVPINEVSKMLGHTTIRMTQHYAKTLRESIRKSMTAVDSKLKEVKRPSA